MGEEILKIGIGELSTVRVKYPNGEIVEMPVELLGAHCDTAMARNTMSDKTAKIIKAFASFLGDVRTDGFPIGIEFVIPVKPSAHKI